MSQTQPTEKLKDELVDVAVGLVHRDPDQPRKHFDTEELKRLAESIDENGQAVRAVIRPHPERTGGFMLVMGERRWRAISLYCKQVRILRCILRYDVGDQHQSYCLSFLENVHRKGLYPLELAESFRDLIQGSGLNQLQVARMVGRDASYVNEHLSLLRLLPTVQKFLDPARPKNKRMGVSVAVAISRLPQDLQLSVAKYAMERGRRFHDVEEQINHLMDQEGIERTVKRKRGHQTLLTHLRKLHNIMRTRFNTADAVNKSYYTHGHVPLKEIDETINLAAEVQLKLTLLVSQLGDIRKKKAGK